MFRYFSFSYIWSPSLDLCISNGDVSLYPTRGTPCILLFACSSLVPSDIYAAAQFQGRFMVTETDFEIWCSPHTQETSSSTDALDFESITV